MSLSESMIQEFAHECAITKRLLERIPEDKLSWKPHEKSMSLGRLASHIAEIPHWGAAITSTDQFDMATADYKPPVLGSRSEILAALQNHLDIFNKALQGKSDQELFRTWKLKNGSHVVVELPRAAALRSFVISHVIHHRGQFAVYLRLNDVPLPSIYGPSADEG